MLTQKSNRSDHTWWVLRHAAALEIKYVLKATGFVDISFSWAKD